MTTVLLLIIGILLIAVNIRAIKKNKSSFKNAFDNASINIKDYDLEIGKLRKEFAETIMELQNEVENLKDKLDVMGIHNNKIDALEEKKENYEENNINENTEIDNREINNVKIDDIERLMKAGLSIDSISEKLGIGKGEILLIKKLYIK